MPPPKYFEKILYCPFCGSEYGKDEFNISLKYFICGKCRTTFYQNSTPSIAAIIPRQSNPSQIIFTRRAIEPGKGLLDFPGGILNYHETPAEGTLREIREELNLKVSFLGIFYAAVVPYLYQGMENSVLTIYTLCAPVEKPFFQLEKKEIASAEFFNCKDLLSNKNELAFSVDYIAIKKYVQSL